jgi:hypothetical protein
LWFTVEYKHNINRKKKANLLHCRA